MAYEVPGFKISGLEAAADLSTHQFKFVKLDTAGRVAAISAVTDIPIGILQNKPSGIGVAAEVMADGISKVQGDADLARDDMIGTSIDGQAAKYIAGTDTTKYIVGRVLEDNSAAGGLATVLFDCKSPSRGT